MAANNLFEKGFDEAIRFLTYVKSNFSLNAAHHAFPPESEYEARKATENGIVVHNHFWTKYCAANEDAVVFYHLLDDDRKKQLYAWFSENK